MVALGRILRRVLPRSMVIHRDGKDGYRVSPAWRNGERYCFDTSLAVDITEVLASLARETVLDVGSRLREQFAEISVPVGRIVIGIVDIFSGRTPKTVTTVPRSLLDRAIRECLETVPRLIPAKEVRKNLGEIVTRRESLLVTNPGSEIMMVLPLEKALAGEVEPEWIEGSGSRAVNPFLPVLLHALNLGAAAFEGVAERLGQSARPDADEELALASLAGRRITGTGRHADMSISVERPGSPVSIELQIKVPFAVQIASGHSYLAFDVREHPLIVFTEIVGRSHVMGSNSVFVWSSHPSVLSHPHVLSPRDERPVSAVICTGNTMSQITRAYRSRNADGSEEADPASCVLAMVTAGARVLRHGCNLRGAAAKSAETLSRSQGWIAPSRVPELRAAGWEMVPHRGAR